MQPRFIHLDKKAKQKLEVLVKESASDGAHRTSKRIHAVLLNNMEYTSGEISGILNTSRSKVSEWLKIFDDEGVDGLKEGFRSGRPSRLSDIQKIYLCDIIDSGPIAFGYASGIWTSKRIAKAIHEEFNIDFHPGHVRKLLQEFGFSVQSPKRILALADKAKQAKWRCYTYPNLKKKQRTKARE